MSDARAEPQPVGERSGRRRYWPLGLLVGVVAMALLAAGVLVGRATAGRSTPGDQSADAGFARDMQVHHAQAVRMAMIVRDTSADPTLRTMAYDIALSQQEQSGQLHGWLTQWNLPQTGSRPAMAWMPAAGSGSHGAGHGADPATGLRPDGRMPGMASRAELDQLSASSGRAAETLFLRLMIAHHRGGVAMAQAGVKLAERPEVRTLAASIATSQAAELTAMETMLKDRGAPP